MLEMLCAIPSPCGGEEIAKKYITQKFPDCYADAFGNLVRKIGNGGRKIMIYAALDEDAAVAMDVQGDKVFFSHLGKRKIYPGQTVSFGGFTGVVCAEGDKPEEKQYIRLLDCEEGIEIGRCGVFEGEFEGEPEKENATLLGKNMAARAAISAMLQDFEVKNTVYFVFGVQSNHKNKGLSAAISAIEPDEILVFEETDKKQFALKLLTKGFSCTKEASAKAEAAFESCGIEFIKTADGNETSAGSVLPWGKSCVIGVPVLFPDFVRQGIKTKTVLDLNRFIKSYTEEK